MTTPDPSLRNAIRIDCEQVGPDVVAIEDIFVTSSEAAIGSDQIPTRGGESWKKQS